MEIKYKVTLRRKKIGNGKESLYLDFYPEIPHPDKPGKFTRRHFLRKWIYAPIKYKNRRNKNGVVKQIPVYSTNTLENLTAERYNADRLMEAEAILTVWKNKLGKMEIYTDEEREKLKKKEQGAQNFVEYFKKLTDKRREPNRQNWLSTYNYLHAFTKGARRFADLNEIFCNEFRDYLLSTESVKSKKVTLSVNSASSYFNKLKAAMKQAYKDGLLTVDVNAKVSSIKPEETQRNFLTEDELNELAATECDSPLLKRAALFSALSGLRFSDIQKLRWVNVEHIRGRGYCIRFRQQKTKGVELLDISDQARELMGKKGSGNDLVFEGLYYSAHQNKILAAWIKDAGITKDITFHCFRHTYATLQLSMGTDIYTVSKLLGHRELKTTQVYAKVIDQRKREAVNKIQIKL